MKRSIAVDGRCSALAAVGAAVAYQAAARERDYRRPADPRRRRPARRPDLRRHRGLQRRHRPAARLDARPPPARRDLPAAPRRPRRGRARFPHGRGARPDRDAAARSARRRALPAAAVRPRRRRVRALPAARRSVGARQLQAGARPLSRRRRRRARWRRSTDAVRLDDRLADAHYLLGLCLREKGRTADALRALRTRRRARARA